MEHSPSSEGCNHSIRQENIRLLWKLKAHWCVHMSPTLVSILSQVHPVE